MKYETFLKVKRVITLIFAIIIAKAVIMDNWLLAVIATVVMVAITILARRSVKGVVNDERDYVNAGKAARMSLSIFSVLGAILALVLMFNGFESVGSVLAYCVCALLLLQAVFFSYYAKQN